ncbi:serine/threonine-protein kinase [Polyangium mundeleinium]|uniref:AAA family ATPase n=1 Tax=Polyangium mundeleinium TaxID=2995306 RepID=A0ABT5ESM3_9BACT|nr:serine/threonine-protein kinase [Polyangium mundeleinium]MDC0744811.1 AAA family ATPase [Polyangium mundeleinium]
MEGQLPTRTAAPESFAEDDRFRLRNLLGKGSLGLVYQARDEEMDEDVALKTLPRLDPEHIYHIKEEFRTLAGITHPNLVELHELFVDASRCFFTMELVDGVPFTEHVRGPRAEGVLGRLTLALEQLVRGVAALHAEGKLHRDIKPSNVLVSGAGRVVLLDFDLATCFRPEDTTYTSSARLYGTPHYMPPEQMYGEQLSPAADWYAVGILIFEAMCGQFPFDGPFADMLRSKERGAPPLLRTVALDTSPVLDELVRALLHPDPRRRAGETEILEALRGAKTHRRTTGFPAAAPAAPFVGRDDEKAALRRAYHTTHEGAPAIVHVTGASGLGKTELVKRFLRSIDDGQPLILRGQCHPQESVPYKGLDRIVDALSRYLISLPEDEAAALRPPRAAALMRVFPVLGRVPSLHGAGETEVEVDPQELRAGGFRALRETLARIAARRPVVLWIDDLQWGDEDSAALLRELVRPPSAPPLLLLLSYRRDEAARGRLLAGLWDGVPRSWVHDVPVMPLETKAVRALASALGGGPDEGRVTEIAAESDGSPLLVGLLAGESQAGGVVTSEGPARRRPLQELMRRRLDRLDERARRILEITAVAGRPLERALVLRAAGLNVGRAELLMLVQQQLLRDARVADRPALQMYHDRIREVILDDLPAERVAEYHRRLAEALLARGALDPEALVEHWLGAGERRRAGEVAALAAERAAAALAFDRAAALYSLSLEHADEDATSRAVLLEKLGEALSMAGRGRDSAESFEAAVRMLAACGGSASRSAMFDLRRRAAEEYLRAGHVDAGVAALERVLDDVGLRYPPSPARALATRVLGHARLDLRGLSFTPRSAEEVRPDDLARIDACWSAGLGLAWIDRVRTWAFQAQFALLALDAGEGRRVSRALAAEASELAARGGEARMRKSEGIICHALELAEQSGDPRSIAFATLMDGSIAFYAGRFRRGVQRCEDARQIARERCRGVAWEMTTANLLGLASRIYLGEVAEVCEALPQLIEEARSRGDRLAAASLAAGLPNLAWLCADNPEEARRRIDDAMALWGQRDFQLQHYLDLIARVHLDLYLGDGDAAFARVMGAWSALRSSFYMLVQNFRVTLLHLRARAALAAAASRPRRRGLLSLLRGMDRERLLRSAEADATRIAREDAGWARPLAASLRAAAAAARGQHKDATEGLTRAASGFERVDMALHAAAARHARGALEGGDTKAALQRESAGWMASQGVVRPEKLAWVLVPVGEQGA